MDILNWRGGKQEGVCSSLLLCVWNWNPAMGLPPPYEVKEEQARLSPPPWRMSPPLLPPRASIRGSSTWYQCRVRDSWVVPPSENRAPAIRTGTHLCHLQQCVSGSHWDVSSAAVETGTDTWALMTPRLLQDGRSMRRGPVPSSCPQVLSALDLIRMLSWSHKPHLLSTSPFRIYFFISCVFKIQMLVQLYIYCL